MGCIKRHTVWLSFSKGEKVQASTRHFIHNFIHYFPDFIEIQVLKDILCRLIKKKKKKHKPKLPLSKYPYTHTHTHTHTHTQQSCSSAEALAFIWLEMVGELCRVGILVTELQDINQSMK